jgi:hypothetical protein
VLAREHRNSYDLRHIKRAETPCYHVVEMGARSAVP